MRLRTHRLSAETFAALAAGGGTKSAVTALADVEYSKRLLLIRGVVERAASTGHPDAAGAARGFELLSALQEEAPGAVDVVLRHPSTGAWAQHTVRSLATGDASAPGRMEALAAAAAVRAGARRTLEVTAGEGLLSLPSLGAADVAPGRAIVRAGPAGAEITGADGRTVRIPADPHTDAPGWQGLRRLTAHAGGQALDLLVDDLDPYRMPAMRNVAGRLGADEARLWDAALGPAWETLVRHHRVAAEEIGAGLRVLTPLSPPDHGQVSATAPDTIGCAAMSTPPSARSMAVTLAHEIQHGKLAVLLELVDLALPDDGSRYYAPWRDDPRPVSGLLQGAYAYLGVTAFWRRQRTHETGEAAAEAHAEFARWRAAVDLVVGTLRACDRLTPAGTTFVSGMYGTLRSWADEPVPAAAAAQARREEERHRAHWRRDNGELPSTAGLT
ncbi:HEXXH motif domain-containing protein [Actinomadura sp. DC4]|uniref:HEXXH motif domain-containing protein n=1 Tax=Actinomadura sp. DC4 TaxID=3055069 RepID=UPI0025AF57E4|nr:HEXXH motif domain-containing protein [Actinomadura sp. DC4]MDN3353812.1 HEXXH motif domain-containing protein [Actinomadura sp. DC4]